MLDEADDDVNMGVGELDTILSFTPGATMHVRFSLRLRRHANWMRFGECGGTARYMTDPVCDVEVVQWRLWSTKTSITNLHWSDMSDKLTPSPCSGATDGSGVMLANDDDLDARDTQRR